MFEIETLVLSGTRRVSLIGEFDLAAVEEARSALDASSEDAPLEIDLGRLTFIDSSGIGVLVAACEAAEQAGRDVRILPGPEGVQRVFEIVGLTDRLPFADPTD